MSKTPIEKIRAGFKLNRERESVHALKQITRAINASGAPEDYRAALLAFLPSVHRLVHLTRCASHPESPGGIQVTEGEVAQIQEALSDAVATYGWLHGAIPVRDSVAAGELEIHSDDNDDNDDSDDEPEPTSPEPTSPEPAPDPEPLAAVDTDTDTDGDDLGDSDGAPPPPGDPNPYRTDPDASTMSAEQRAWGSGGSPEPEPAGDGS